MQDAVTSHWDQKYAHSAERKQKPSCTRALDFFGDVAGKTLLEIGCGDGAESFFWTERGADVTGVDISQVAIDKANAKAAALGVETFRGIQIDAMRIPELGQFDLVYGSMILHHIEPFEDFARALAGALAPGGRAFFAENNAQSSLLIWCRDNLAGRFGIPKYGDTEEHPLTPAEVDILRDHFKVTVIYPQFRFFVLVSGYLLGKRFRPTMRRLDNALYKVPGLRKYSYRQDLLLHKP